MNDGRIEEHRMDHGVIRIFVTDRGKRYTHHECERRLKSSMYAMMRWCARTVHTRTIWLDTDMRASELRDMRWILGEIAAYVEHVMRELDKIEGVDRQGERIRALRDVNGRTPAEAATYLAKADELERGAA